MATKIGAQKLLKSFLQIPSPPGIPLVRFLLSGGPSQLHKHCNYRHRQLGPIYREKIGPLDLVFVSNPELIRQVFANEGSNPAHNIPEPWLLYNKIHNVQRGIFFASGHEWQCQRKVLNGILLDPTISQKHYAKIIDDVTQDLILRWSNRCHVNEQKIILDKLKDDLCRWSIECVATLLFGRRLGCLESTPDPYVNEFVENVKRIFVETANFHLISAHLAQRLNLKVWQRLEHSITRSLQLAKKFVEQGFKSDQLLVDNASIVGRLRRSSIKEETIVGITMDLIIAAADTSSNAGLWLMYLLAKNSNVQMQLREETKVATNNNKSRISDTDIDSMPLAKACVKESLRLYPIAPFIARTVPLDIILGNYSVPQGTTVVFSLIVTSRDPTIFDKPDQFIPARWLRSKNKVQTGVPASGYAMLPFGAGARSCVGRRMADLQLRYLTSHLCKEHCIEPAHPEVDVGIKLQMITTPDRDIELLMQRSHVS